MKRLGKKISLTVSLVFGLVLLNIFTEQAIADDGFRGWLESFYPVAQQQGITQKTWDYAFFEIEGIDKKVLKKANYQPEFTTKIWDYIDARVNSLSVKRGEKKARYFAGTLSDVEKKFGVKKSVLLAIWSMESNYGAIFHKPERLHYIPQALATLAYKDPKRKKFAKKQLIAAVQILQAGDIDKSQMSGSWAGAMGHTQFIPTSYLAYGVDMDKNGKRDIWNSVPDALATAANLLAKNGWRPGKTWGYEVNLPANAELYKDKTKLLSEWQKLGFLRSGNRNFPRPGDKAVLKILAGPDGPGFLMLKNFFVLKRYNNADSYALAVGLLADRIAGYKGMKLSWPRPPGAISMAEKMEIQELLKQKDCYSGEVDGYIGPESRNGIKNCQKKLGLVQDGTPSRELLLALRKKN